MHAIRTARVGVIAAMLVLGGACSAFAADQSWDSLLAKSDQFRNTLQFDSADAYAQAALRIADSIYGPRDTRVALTFMSLGLAQVRSDPRVAEASFRRALAIWEIDPAANPRMYAKTLNALGIVVQSSGRYSEADGFLRRSLEIKLATLPPGDRDIAVAYNNLAVLDIDRGRYAMADWELRKSGEILLVTSPHDSGAFLMNLSAVYRHQFRYHDAVEISRAGLRVCLRSGNGAAVARTAHNLADALTHVGNYTAADSLLGSICQYLDTATLARTDWYLKSEKPSFFVYLAKSKRRFGQFSAADSLLKLADSLASEVTPPEFKFRLLALEGRGELEVEKGNYATALDFYREAIQYGDSTLGADHPSLATCHEAAAAAYLKANRPMESFREARTASENLYQNLRAITATVPDDEALAYAAQLSDAVSLSLRALRASHQTTPRDLEYASSLVLRTKGVMSEVLLARHHDISARLDAGSRELHERRAHVAKLLTDEILAGTGGANTTARQRRVDSLETIYRQTSDALALADPVFQRRERSWNVTDQELRRAVSENAVAIDFYSFDHGDSTGVTDYAAVVADRKMTRLVWLSSPGRIDSLVREYCVEMQRVASRDHPPTQSDVVTFRKISGQLYHEAVAPVLAGFSGKTRLLVSPAGRLGFVSFPGLWTENGGYLVENFEVACVDAVRELAEPPLKDRPGRGLLAFGDPDFDRTTAGSAPAVSIPDSAALAVSSTFLVRGGCSSHLDSLLAPLPGTRVEIEDIAGNWPRRQETVDLELGADATEDRVKSLAPGHRVLHLATHGFYLNENCEMTDKAATSTSDEHSLSNPLLTSGILLAGARQTITNSDANRNRREDGVLSALEVAEMDLRGMELVTLSSCESGLGATRGSEGMYGLRRAFSFAGARTLLVSLWQVPDAATAMLMPDIYARLDKPLPQAVREAELRYLTQLRSAGLADHPLLWAGFVPYGRPDAGR